MNTHTKRQAVFLTRLGPLAHDIPFRTHVHGVPRLVLAVPKVHIIMMVTQCHEITGTHALVKTYQRIRLPLFGLPFINHVLKPEILRITIFFHVHVILPMTRIVHVTRIPIARLRFALRPPMRPNAEFGIAKPIRTLIRCQRFPRRLVFARLHRFGLYVLLCCRRDACKHRRPTTQRHHPFVSHYLIYLVLDAKLNIYP